MQAPRTPHMETGTNRMKTGTYRMETAPVGRLLRAVSLPIMLSMVTQALYNVVDSIFIARYSEKALSAISLTFPMQTLMIAVGIGTCVGVNAFLSRTLGQKRMERARAIVQHGALLALVSYLVALLVGLLFTRRFFSFQTNDPEIIAHGIDYMSVCMVFSCSMFGQQLFEKLLQASGRSMFSMISQMVGAVVNIMLDPILIHGWGGLPALGAKGAAIATVIGQTMGFACAFLFHQRENRELRLSFVRFSFDRTIVKEIYKIGLPAMVMQAIGSATNFFLNGILLTFSTTATAVYGICARLQNFVFMPVYGLTSGMLPIMSYNHGARQKARILDTRRYALLYMAIIVLAGTALMQILPGPLLGLFGASEEMRLIGIPALRIISLSFIFEGFCLICQTSFQSVGRNRASVLSSVSRQIAMLLPLAYMLSLSGDLRRVWLAFPIAYAASALVSLVLWRDVRQKNIDPPAPHAKC